MHALLFDCDGVLADTERDGHRVAFNQAFAEHDLDVHWSVETYGELVRVSGGKERMRHYFDAAGWPDETGDRDAFIRALHRTKTDRFLELVAGRALPLRSGVVRLIDAAIEENVRLAVCSTSNARAVQAVVAHLLGPQRGRHFRAILAGDVVQRKKPDPEIYHLARQRLGLRAAACLVIEDSRNGLLAARGAGMPCLVTPSTYTGNEDFSEADRVVPELGDPPGPHVTLADLRALTAA